MTPIRFVTLSSIGIALLFGLAGAAAAEEKSVEIFGLFAMAYDGNKTMPQFFGAFSTRERCGQGAEKVVERLRPMSQSISWGCMSLDVDAAYLERVKAFEAGQPPEEPKKDVRRAPEA